LAQPTRDKPDFRLTVCGSSLLNSLDVMQRTPKSHRSRRQVVEKNLLHGAQLVERLGLMLVEPSPASHGGRGSAASPGI